MTESLEPARRLVDAALALAAEKGWRAVTLAEVAGRADLGLVETWRLAPCKAALLDLLARQVDRTMLAGGPAESGDSPRDRLFDTMMRRFDALTPYRPGLRAVLRTLPGDPCLGLGGLSSLRRSMAWTVETAGIALPGLRGILIRKGVTAVWLATFRRWLTDESPDLSATMAALDTHLKRAEELWNSIPGLSRRSAPAPATSPSDAADPPAT